MTARKRGPRRNRSDSIAAGVAAFHNAANEIDPPPTVKLRSGDLELWRRIMRARARDEWSEIDLQHAGNLARCMSDIERVQEAIEGSGDMSENARGTQVVNPRHQLLETLTRRSIYLSRFLHLHASVLSGNPEDQRKGRAAEVRARDAVQSISEDDDGLLATPTRLQ